jgi:hypothetical protein
MQEDTFPLGSAGAPPFKPAARAGPHLLLAASWSYTAHLPPWAAVQRSGVEVEEGRRDR